MSNRRQVITLLGGAATRPFAAHAQQATTLPTIGFLGVDATAWNSWTVAFVERLRALGWIEGRTIAIEYRWTEGRPERVAELAGEFIRLKVDVIVTNGTAVATVKQQTSIIPIVFPMGIDPIASDVIKNLARPGGNVTGLSSQQSDLAGKRLELLREVVSIRHLAIIADVANAQAALEMSEVQVLARKLGIEVAPLEIRRTEDITPALKRSLSASSQPDALYIVVSALVAVNRPRIMTFALTARLPTIASIREFSQAGGLMSYGPNYSDQFRRAAELVDKVLRGTKPGDIPVEQPTKFDFVINLITANALGLDIPPTLLALADEVIE